ncbi:MAG: hypothetical protein V8R80_08995 [Eubacterium sp.]
MSNAKEEKDMNVDGLHFSHESVQSQPASPVRNYKDTVFRMLFSDKEELPVFKNASNLAFLARCGRMRGILPLTTPAIRRRSTFSRGHPS